MELTKYRWGLDLYRLSINFALDFAQEVPGVEVLAAENFVKYGNLMWRDS